MEEVGRMGLLAGLGFMNNFGIQYGQGRSCLEL